MTEPVTIHINLRNGSVDIVAPIDAIDSIFAKIESFLPQLVDSYTTLGGRQSEPTDGDGDEVGSDDSDERVQESKLVGDKSSRRGKARGSHRETYKFVDLGLTEVQREALRQFFSAKQPKGQNDQTLVIMYWLTSEAKLARLGWNQLYSAFRLLGDVGVPAKISSVLGNMVGQGFVQNVGGGQYELTHLGEDRVNLKLPYSPSEKKK